VTPAVARIAGWSWGLYAGGAVVLAGVAVWLFIGSEPVMRAREAAHEP
jgi:hypothetical protein